MLRMVSYPHRPKSGHITCYLNRTYHVPTTSSLVRLDHNLPNGASCAVLVKGGGNRHNLGGFSWLRKFVQKARPAVLGKTLKVTWLRGFYAWSRWPQSRLHAPWARANASSPTRSPPRPCGRRWTPSLCAAPSSLAKASVTRRPCSTSARRLAPSFPMALRFRMSTLRSIRSRARTCAPLALREQL